MAVKKKPALQRIGPYEVIEKIAEGGMGAVYKARRPGTSEVVAIKVISPGMARDPDLLKRFEQEFEVTRSLNHPGMVRGLDFGEDDGQHFLVMEFVDGGTLGKRIEKQGRLPEAEAVRLIVQVAEALYQAHQRGIIHRDVKPDNILVSSDGQAKLTDLGIAKNTEADLNITSAGIAMGTPHFMPPEQIADAKNVDHRCDIYALAATLYMAVTGQLPFGTRTYLGIFKTKAADQLTPPRELVPSLSKRVDVAIRRAMQADPDRRFADFAAFVEALTGRPPAPAVTDPTPIPAPAGRTARARVERRAVVRFPSQMEGFCHPIGADKQPRWLGTFVDISAGGISMLLRRRFEPGTILSLELEGFEPGRPRRLLARVVHVKQKSPGRWIVGCAFAGQIPEEEVKTLL